MAGPRRPLIIGIAGGTGSGKTTLAHRIVEELPRSSAVVIPHDAYYRDLQALGPEEIAAVNFDHPDSLDTALLVEHLDRLAAGQPVERPQYDFVRHRRRGESVRIAPVPIVVVEGILLFVDRALCKRFDIRLFIDTPADIRVLRRIRRDMKHRGRSFEDIRNQYYETVRPMHEAFVEPSRRRADLIIPEGGNQRVALEVIVARIGRELRVSASSAGDPSRSSPRSSA